MSNTQRGFTIIELVFVIAIIGILAAFAVPRFVDLQKDARASNIRALAGAVRAASAMVHGKAIVEQKEKAGTGETVTVEGPAGQTAVDLVYGYPAATANGIGRAIDLDGNYDTSEQAADATTTPPTPASFLVEYTTNAGNAIPNCNFTYAQATATTPPTYTTTVTGC